MNDLQQKAALDIRAQKQSELESMRLSDQARATELQKLAVYIAKLGLEAMLDMDMDRKPASVLIASDTLDHEGCDARPIATFIEVCGDTTTSIIGDEEVEDAKFAKLEIKQAVGDWMRSCVNAVIKLDLRAERLQDERETTQITDGKDELYAGVENEATPDIRIGDLIEALDIVAILLDNIWQQVVGYGERREYGTIPWRVKPDPRTGGLGRKQRWLAFHTYSECRSEFLAYVESKADDNRFSGLRKARKATDRPLTDTWDI